MKAFVTGSTGLLGNNLVRLLVDQGHEVKGLIRSPMKARRLLGDLEVELVKGDMRLVTEFAPELDGCDAVFHTAAYFREYYQPGDHVRELEEINVHGTIELMTEANRHGVPTFIHVSSAGTIGLKPDGSPGDEKTPPSPVAESNLYFRSKVNGDAEIRAFQREHDLRIVEILPGWMWGPGDAAPTAAGQMALDFLARKLPGIIDGGSSIVDARDVAAAMLAAVERGRPGQRYIVGGRYYTLERVLKGLERVSGVRGPRFKLPHALVMTVALLTETFGRMTSKEVLITREGVRTMHAKLAVTSAKAERELGATFRKLNDTLRDVVRWYKQNPMPKKS